MVKDFLMNSAKTFHHFYRPDQIYILTYRNIISTNDPEQVSDEGASIRKCQSEEANQWAIHHTLHCVG